MSNKKPRFEITVCYIIHHPDGLQHYCLACELPAAPREMYLSKGNVAFPRKSKPLISPPTSLSISPFGLHDLQPASVFPKPVKLRSPLRGLRPNTVTASLYLSLSESFEPLISNFSLIYQVQGGKGKLENHTGEISPRKEQSKSLGLTPAYKDEVAGNYQR